MVIMIALLRPCGPKVDSIAAETARIAFIFVFSASFPLILSRSSLKTRIGFPEYDILFHLSLIFLIL